MQHEADEVARWLTKSRHDASVAGLILQENRVELDVAAFHCQQAIEKLLKADLVHSRHPFEKIHDLGRLLDYCVEIDDAFESLRDRIEPLTIFAIAYRYPGPADPAREEVRVALAVVEETDAFVRARVTP